MSKRILTQEQIKELLKNEHVATCSIKSITFTKEFKVAAVKKYQAGFPASHIFMDANLNLALIGRDVPSDNLKRWRKVFKERGEVGLQKDGRGSHKKGGRPKDPQYLTEKEKLKYLEAQVAYLKAENAFLAKLRKQR